MLMPPQKRTLPLILTLIVALWIAPSLFAQPYPLPQIPQPKIPQNQADGLSLTLTRTPPGKLEQALRQICGHRVAAESQNQYVFTTNQNDVRRQCGLRIDPQSNQALLSGDKLLCDSVFQLLTAIDQLPPAGKKRQIVTYHPRVQTEILAQAFESYRTPALAPKPRGETDVRYLNSNLQQKLNPIQQVQFQDGSFDGGIEQMMPVPGMMPGDGSMPGSPLFGNPAAVGLPDDFKYWFIPDLDLAVVEADGARLNKFIEMIRQIEDISKLNKPQIEIVHLKHVSNVALGDVIRGELYSEIFRTVPGSARIIPMVSPNAMMLIGWGEAMEVAKEFVASLDKPAVPEHSQLHIFKLKHISATQARTTLQGAQGPFLARVGGGSGFMARIAIFVDTRTNSLIVHGVPNDLEEFKRILDEIDVSDSSVPLRMTTRKLKNSLASDLEPTLTKALTGGATDGRVPAFELLIQGEQGQRLIKSGILSNVTITPDVRNNTLIINAPESCMPFIDELITLLDVSAPEAVIKVFDIEFADAESLVNMLKVLMPSNLDGVTGPQLPGTAGEDALIQIRLAVDRRTNSIVASGSRRDLEAVEAVVNRLDQESFQTRKLVVYPLKNMKAVTYETNAEGRALIDPTKGTPVVSGVATIVNEYITSRRKIQQESRGVISPYEQIESEVIVVPDSKTNSLIISATPKYFDEIMKLVEEIDQSPAQVVIQVLIAEVTLSEDKEWAAELGFQDPLLFLRGSSVPGLNFNNLTDPLGNDPVRTGSVGTQLLSNFGAGRSGGGGGMVFSASSDYLNIMIRALHEKRRLEVLSNPKITAMNNQRAIVSVGQKIPRYKGIIDSGYGVSRDNIEDEDVAMELVVTPTISPEGIIVMNVVIRKDKVGPEIQVGSTRMTTIDTANIGTIISAANNETVVLGGLITKDENKILRKVPLLGDIPFLGKMWRHETTKTERKEILVILTPRIVKNQDDKDQVKQMETARMSWCLSNVVEIYGDLGAYNVVSDRPYTGNAPVITPGPVKTEALQPMESQFIAPTLPKKN